MADETTGAPLNLVTGGSGSSRPRDAYAGNLEALNTAHQAILDALTAQDANRTADLATKAQRLTRKLKTASYSLVAGDLVAFDSTGASVTGALPTAPPDGTRCAMKHIIQGSTSGVPNTMSALAGSGDFFNRASGPTTISTPVGATVGYAWIFEYDAVSHVWTVFTDIPVSVADARYDPIGAAAAMAIALGGV